MRAAVVGHLEWVQFLRVPHVPAPGEIVHADDSWAEPGGGGPDAAVQLTKLADEAMFFTALGDDDLGPRSLHNLRRRGLRVEAVFRDEPTRRAITHIDPSGERTITVIGERLAPHGDDPLPWEELADVDAVYFTAGDIAALRRARAARILVATARVLPVLAAAGIELDALVGSGVDESERYQDGDLEPAPRLVVQTNGSQGGTFQERDAAPVRFDAPQLERPIVDRYGAGDSFAAGLTYALGAGRPANEAVALAARCGAAVLTGRGPYEGQLKRADL